MPNIQTTAFEPIVLPASDNGFTFHSYATSPRGEQLVLTTYGEKAFLLQILQRKHNTLIKTQKLTRLSPVSILQDALHSFASLHDLELTYANIHPEKKSIIQEEDFSILKGIEYFVTQLSYKKKIIVEVGFGSGRHLLYQAKQNPDKLIIGIEIHKPSIEQVIKQCKLQEIDNILIADFDARIFLQLLHSNTVAQIFVHFPVPWDKKPHRRVISDAFVQESLRVLREQGTLELRTDSENYFAYAWDTFNNLSKYDLHIRKNYDLPISSKYEDRWKRKEKNIYDFILTNEERSEEKKSFDTITFEEEVSFEDVQKRFQNITIKGDDHFVHFEDIYFIDEKNGFIKISLGAYEKPEHKFLLFKENKIQYFPSTMLPLTQNVKSHKIIKEFLYV